MPPPAGIAKLSFPEIAVTAYLPWHQMSDRERQVWTCVYAQRQDEPRRAARMADDAVRALRTLNVDSKELEGPEYDAARGCMGLRFEEFRAWYPVALTIARRGRMAPSDVSDEAIRKAFDTYQRCCTDVY